MTGGVLAPQSDEVLEQTCQQVQIFEKATDLLVVVPAHHVNVIGIASRVTFGDRSRSIRV